MVRVATVDAELAADHLWAFGPAAIEEREGTEGTVLLAGFDDDRRAAAAAASLERTGLATAEVAPVTDDGLDGWRRWARIERAHPFVIVPTWMEAPELEPGRHLLLVDPAHTFGSGSHPTTRLVLSRLARLLAPGDAVLDVGCGSGILAVAAALLGAPRVRGVDIDPGAPTATNANARINGVAERVTASLTPLAAVAAGLTRYDLVTANLLAPVIIDAADDLERVLAPGGTLVVSGLLADRWEAATDHLAGLEPIDVAIEAGWAAVTLRRIGPLTGPG